MTRVHDSADGFAALSEAEKLFYAVSRFRNAINNDGFYDFFFNSSGSYYELIENALISLDEPQYLDLLYRAKEIVLPGIAVPSDWRRRREILPIPGSPRPDWAKKMDELDRTFYSMPDTLTPKLQAFARQQGLVPGEARDKERRV
jgi:hypothetical protein